MVREEVIHKIKLDAADDLIFSVPATARFVAVDHDPGDERGIAVWYRLTVEAQEERAIRLSVVGTGHLFPTEATYLGTVVMPPFVWHVLCYED